ncbi:hypothetical protein R3P38DRAFT_2784447 [Favolaschia claudopus]|uniref:Uncharacterized protein n=1 Tax=Favolaschia claudopus TaxID=2862362 RepID=A0AAW0AYA9_9AGAR
MAAKVRNSRLRRSSKEGMDVEGTKRKTESESEGRGKTPRSPKTPEIHHNSTRNRREAGGGAENSGNGKWLESDWKRRSFSGGGGSEGVRDRAENEGRSPDIISEGINAAKDPWKPARQEPEGEKLSMGGEKDAGGVAAQGQMKVRKVHNNSEGGTGDRVEVDRGQSNRSSGGLKSENRLGGGPRGTEEERRTDKEVGSEADGLRELRKTPKFREKTKATPKTDRSGYCYPVVRAPKDCKEWNGKKAVLRPSINGSCWWGQVSRNRD